MWKKQDSNHKWVKAMIWSYHKSTMIMKALVMIKTNFFSKAYTLKVNITILAG